MNCSRWLRHRLLRGILALCLGVMMGCGWMGVDAAAAPLLLQDSSLFSNLFSSEKAAPGESGDRYEIRPLHNGDSIGKRYMGRDIARYMDYKGAAWLERANRELEEQPEELLAALNLKPTDVVADIGAGTGYFSLRISPMVPEGRVLAVDIQQEMLDMLNFFKEASGADNVETVLGAPDTPNLPPETVDLALIVDAYHEFEYPYEMMTGIVEALKPGGRAVLVEYRGEDWLLPIKRLHKMTQKQVKREMDAVGLRWEETLDFLPQQHVLIFAKPDETNAA